MKNILIVGLLVLMQSFCFGQTQAPAGKSIYETRLNDPEAIYFTPEKFDGIRADGKTDVSDALQQAVNLVKTSKNFGVLFIPEGTYLITKTIYVPQAVRIIGYGKNRPEFVLGKNSPGFQVPDPNDAGLAKYMFWYTGGIARPNQPVPDAGAGTFYSAMSNVNLRIEDGNPQAVALRTHYAQHSFIEHVDIHAGNGKAGMYAVGNEMADVRFFDGDYGIYTGQPSPGWPFMMVDTYFEGQRKIAIQSRKAGLTIVRMNVKNVPTVFDILEDNSEKLFIEDSQFENVSGPALIISNEDNAFNQINFRNVDCMNVPVFASYRRSGKPSTKGAGAIYKIKRFVYGQQMDEVNADPVYKTINEMLILKTFPSAYKRDVPDLPAGEWVNLKSLGATGDGETDDTKAIQDAIDKYPTIYVPQGWYRVSETIKMKPNTVLIGLTPIGTQFILAENTLAYGSFGAPKALLESPKGGKNILTGIGLSTGANNPRAVALKWQAGAESYVNDVKFIGGHGSMNRVLPAPAAGQNRGGGGQANTESAWDTQYWSLWITNGGGGTFKDIWTANTFATSGAYISNTSTPGHIYAMSVEHHVRNEVRFNKVSNWKVYALQLEEESRESTECQPLEIANCSNMVFSNLYTFRVIRVIKPYPYSTRVWDSKNIEFLNIHNYSQIKYTTDLAVYDMKSKTEVRPWELARLYISGNTVPAPDLNKVKQLASGFEFAEGICKDSKGNIYFAEQRMKRIYKWSATTKTISLLADYPWEPLSLVCDKNDNLLIVFKYNPKPGYLVDGKPEVYTNPPDAAGTSFSLWGNNGFGTLVYAVDPNNPDETIHLLQKAPMGSVKNVYKAIYPSHRWRDGRDFNTVSVNKATECWVAPDGVTIIPIVYDLARAAGLMEAYPGKIVYSTDEYAKRTVKLDVSPEGYVSNLKYFVEKGEFGLTTDSNGNIYIADGEVYVYNSAGKQIKVIKVPERPSSLVLSKDSKTLYITGRKSLYSVQVE